MLEKLTNSYTDFSLHGHNLEPGVMQAHSKAFQYSHEVQNDLSIFPLEMFRRIKV